jgi:hypothetical protein
LSFNKFHISVSVNDLIFHTIYNISNGHNHHGVGVNILNLFTKDFFIGILHLIHNAHLINQQSIIETQVFSVSGNSIIQDAALIIKSAQISIKKLFSNVSSLSIQ